MQTWKIDQNGVINKFEDDLIIVDNSVKVKITKALLDSNDIALLNGKGINYPIVPSHTAIGLISENNEDSDLNIGTRVALSPYINTEKSLDKRVDIYPNISVMGVDLNGFLQNYIQISKDNIYFLPEQVKDCDAIYIENISFAVKVLSKLKIEKGDYIAVLGGTTLGNLICQLAIYYQAIPILIDTDENKLKLAEECGIYYTINSRIDDVNKKILEFTSGRMANYVVYDPRTKTILQPALNYCQKNGTIALIGYSNQQEVSLNIREIIKKQLCIIGINNGYNEISTAINLLATKAIDTSHFKNKEFKFENTNEAFENMKNYPLEYDEVLINF